MPSIYQLTPPLLGMNAIRIDSSLANRNLDYQQDSKFFADYPRRRLLIREATIGEFDDLNIPAGEFLQIPLLWCLVTKISDGVHAVVPIYRGRKFWSFMKDDAALSIVLCEMSRREGMDNKEWAAFERRVIAKNNRMLASGSGTIH